MSTFVRLVLCVGVAAGAASATQEATRDTLILQRATIIDGMSVRVPR